MHRAPEGPAPLGLHRRPRPRSPSCALRARGPWSARVRSALATAALATLAACGGDEPPKGPVPVLVEIVAHRFDGAPPRGIAVRHVGKGTLGPPLPLVPVAGRPHVYEVPGAVAGRYLLVVPEGWGPVFTAQPPYLQPDGRPTRVSAGKAYSIYCLSTLTDRPLGDVWAAKRVDASGALGAALPLDVRLDAAAGWVVLRLRPEDWPGALALQGRFADGALTELVLTTLHAGGAPLLRQFLAEPVASLSVTVVGATEPGAPLWVRARVLGLPLDEVHQQPVRDGAASFTNLATSRDGLELALGDDPGAPTYRMKTEAWARAGEVRLHAPLPGRLPVRLPAPPGAAEVRVQVRPEDASSYGWVPATVEGAEIRLDLAPGRWRALVETGGGFAAYRFRVEPGGTLADVEAGPVEAAATVRGSVVNGTGDELVVWERHEDGRWVLGHGFVVRVPVARGRGAGSFEAVLPPGTYRQVVVSARSPVGHPRTEPREFTWMAGAHASVDLDAPSGPKSEGK